MSRIRIEIYDSILRKIYRDCDKYPHIETGGRLLGKISFSPRSIVLTVTDLIYAGPGARRTLTSFFPDPDYMLKTFRFYEQQDPDIEHIGNWHSHYCNGLEHLSMGDIQNYQQVVTDEEYNPDLFLAMLVIPGRRSLVTWLGHKYRIRYYLLTRNNPYPVEITKGVRILRGKESHLEPFREEELKWFEKDEGRTFLAEELRNLKDDAFHLKPFLRKGTLIWKGQLNDSAGEVVEISLAYCENFLVNRKFEVEILYPLAGEKKMIIPGRMVKEALAAVIHSSKKAESSPATLL